MTTDESSPAIWFIGSACCDSRRRPIAVHSPLRATGPPSSRLIRLFSGGFNRLAKKPCHV
jgi:hypothetical protein